MPNDKQKDKPITRQDILKIAFQDMCKGLDKFGPGEILDLLVIHSRRDEVVRYLLTQYPTTVALGNFLSRMPIQKVNKRTFKRLQKRGCIV